MDYTGKSNIFLHVAADAIHFDLIGKDIKMIIIFTFFPFFHSWNYGIKSHHLKILFIPF